MVRAGRPWLTVDAPSLGQYLFDTCFGCLLDAVAARRESLVARAVVRIMPARTSVDESLCLVLCLVLSVC